MLREEPSFMVAGNLVRYSSKAKLWYQPIGFRWAHNFEPYDATETRGFLNYDKKPGQHRDRLSSYGDEPLNEVQDAGRD